MYLPSPFYEKAPHYWLLLGVLFIVVGTYLGFQVERTYMYLGIVIGVACCAWSMRVFSKRSRSRRVPHDGANTGN